MQHQLMAFEIIVAGKNVLPFSPETDTVHIEPQAEPQVSAHIVSFGIDWCPSDMITDISPRVVHTCQRIQGRIFTQAQQIVKISVQAKLFPVGGAL